MSLDKNFQQPSEHLSSLDDISKKVLEARKPIEKDYSSYPNYPALDERELEERAKEFEETFKAKKKSEALALFNSLSAHCQQYIMKTKPYEMYWRAVRISA